MEIHQILTSLREEKNVQQKQVALELNVSQAAISAYENGEYAPSTNMLIALANYYGVSLDYLTGRTKLKLPSAKIEELLKTSKGESISLDLLVALSPDSKHQINQHIMALYELEQLKKQQK